MSLQYLDALAKLGASPSTKYIIPLEFTRLIEPFVGYLEQTIGGEGPSGPGRARTPDSPSQGTLADGSGGSAPRPDASSGPTGG